MAKEGRKIRVGEWLIEPDLLQIRTPEEVHRLEPKVLSLLLFLVEKAPTVTSREEIFQAVWEGRAVVDETLTRAVSLLRQALGDDAKEPRYIETIPTKGYRLIAEVREVGEPEREMATLAERPPTLPRTLPTGRLWPMVGLFLVVALAVASLLVWRGDREGPVPQTRPAIAVMPFDHPSGDVEGLYLADGLTEELIHQLAGVAGLKVVSRTSSMRFRDAPESPAVIGRKLGVDFLLEGSVSVADERVRISSRLIRLNGEEHLFSRSYDRKLEEIFSLQRAVARDVVRETQVRLTAAEETRLNQSGSIDPQAYRLYLQGLQALRKRTPEGLRRSLLLIGQVVEQAPDFALGWSTLAHAHLLTVQFQIDEDGHAAAQQALDRALALDPDSASAQSALGLLYTSRDQDWEKAEAAYRRAIALEPSYARAHQWYSEMLALEGRYREAVDRVRIAVDLDPLSALTHASAGHRLSTAGLYPEAIWELQTAEDLGALFSWHLRELADVLTRLGDEDGAFAARREDLVRHGESLEQLALVDAAFGREGLRGYWLWRLGRMEGIPDPNPFAAAEAYAALGQKEEALRWLAKTLETDILWFLHGQRNPAFDELRDDPRYLELVGQYPLWRPWGDAEPSS